MGNDNAWRLFRPGSYRAFHGNGGLNQGPEQIAVRTEDILDLSSNMGRVGSCELFDLDSSLLLDCVELAHLKSAILGNHPYGTTFTERGILTNVFNPQRHQPNGMV